MYISESAFSNDLTVGYLETKLYTILPNYFSTEYTKYIIEHWNRFIDDCFIAWKKNENLDPFEEILNNIHSSIKFTKDTDDDRIPFLDLLVIKTAKGNIETDIFYKKTNTHRYLCFESAHPKKIETNIPFTLAQGITRIVSNPDRREQGFNPKSTGGCFPPPVRFWLITSEVESFSTRNFTAFPNIKWKIRKNKTFSKFASWVT